MLVLLNLLDEKDLTRETFQALVNTDLIVSTYTETNGSIIIKMADGSILIYAGEDLDALIDDLNEDEECEEDEPELGEVPRAQMRHIELEPDDAQG